MLSCSEIVLCEWVMQAQFVFCVAEEMLWRQEEMIVIEVDGKWELLADKEFDEEDLTNFWSSILFSVAQDDISLLEISL